MPYIFYPENGSDTEYAEPRHSIWRRLLKIAGLSLTILILLTVVITGSLWGTGVIFRTTQIEPIPFSASPFLLDSHPRSNYAPDWLDQLFLQRYGHHYYSSSQYEQPEIDKLESLLKEVESHVPFGKVGVYKEDYFDCSEMSAYIEYYLEQKGYQASIFIIPNEHAWVMVYTTEGWIPIETTNLFIATPTNCKNFSMYSEAGSRYDSIGEIWDEVENISEFDWWDTCYADELEEVATT